MADRLAPLGEGFLRDRDGYQVQSGRLDDAGRQRPLSTTRTGATATFTFKGREVAFATTRDSNRGRVAIYVDGAHSTDLDLGTSSRQTRRVVYSRSWLNPGSHTIEVRSLGGGRVDVDVFIVFN
jgi:hypothetical protein